MAFFNKKRKKPLPKLNILLLEFNRSLMLIADRKLLIRNVIAKIQQLCPVESIYIFLSDQGSGRYLLQNTDDHPKKISFKEKERLANWLSVNEKELIVSSNPDIVSYLSANEQEILADLKTEMIYPLIMVNRLCGFVLLGEKIDRKPFTIEEIGVLYLFLNQAAFAIDHAMLYEQQNERIKKMHRSNRLATLGELAAGAAHEIRNPLTTIRSAIQYLSKEFTNDPAKSEMINEIQAETERINKILQGLLSFASPTALNKAEVNLEQLIHRTLLLIKSTLNKNHIEIQFEYFTENTTIQGDAEQLKQVFLNIIFNAIEAMKDNPSEKPRTLIIGMENGAVIDLKNRYLIVSVEDTGIGITQNDIENVFNPFFTTKSEGTGLGLSICYGIIDRHQGEITINSTPQKGTILQVKLPHRF
ncbi:MAG: histidine kinase [Tannerella sp.]|jgi:signal transduction histidine kinase|nr:histidine kinase [Tannerella sp.]